MQKILFVCCLIPLVCFSSVYCQSKDTSQFENINGTIGSANQWGSGWIDLSSVTDFPKGTELILKIGGSADTVLLRLLPENSTPEKADGIIGKFGIPKSTRELTVKIDSDRNKIWQISVHGSPSPWKQNLGKNNGPATIVWVKQRKSVKQITSTQAKSFQIINGTTGTSDQWGSGWLDLATVTNFTAGTKLRLTLGGSASQVLVRLLPDGVEPGSPAGIIGKFTVPANKIIELVLDADYKNILQISVHGGQNPWNNNLGSNNGPATIMQVESR